MSERLVFWFARSGGWQAMVAGATTGLLVCALVNGLWRAYHREWPRLGRSYYLARLATWLIVPYNLLPRYALGLGTFSFFYNDYRALYFVAHCALIRFPMLVWKANRKDYIPFDFLAIVFEAALVRYSFLRLMSFSDYLVRVYLS